jgi:hypothetical protein
MRRSARLVTVSARCRRERPRRPSLQTTRGVAGAEPIQDLAVGEAVAAGAAGRLGEHRIAAGALQGVDLELGLLVGGGRRWRSQQVSHAGSVAESFGRVEYIRAVQANPTDPLRIRAPVV